MSRIGKKPIEIPSGVEITIDGQVVTAKGPLGTESVTVRPEIAVKLKITTLSCQKLANLAKLTHCTDYSEPWLLTLFTVLKKVLKRNLKSKA